MPIRATALHLHHAPLSGCSARVRIALRLKHLHDNIPITYHPVNLSASDHHSPAYRSLNPNTSIPTLVVELDASQQQQPNITITQSLAIIDALDTLFPSSPPRLIPPAPLASGDSSAAASLRRRATVLDLVALIACDVQPPANKRWRDAITKNYGGDGEAWARRVYERGLGAYEGMLAAGERERGSRFSVGDEVSAADVFLVPAVEGAMRVGLCEVGRRWPRVGDVVRECARLEAFRVGGLGVIGEEIR